MNETQKQLQTLQKTLSEKKYYNHAISLMHWDLETEAPKNSINTTSEVIGFFSKKNYELINTKEFLASLEYLNSNSEELNNIDKRMLYLSTKEQRKLSKIPKNKYIEYNQLLSKSQKIWSQARQENNYDIFAPYLEKIIKYQKDYAELIGYDNHPYNAVLDDYEEGMNVEKLDPFFDSLKDKVVPLLKKIQKATKLDTSALAKKYNIEKQKQYSRKIATKLGFDFDSGLLKESAHPFTLNFNKYDVRMTTRYIEDFFSPSLFSTIHETGHALYEQNIGQDIYNTILGTGVSLGIHESQSRFYENLIGKNKSFWGKNYQELRDLFPENLKNITLDDFYKAINNVSSSLIRVEADELTYSLHILIRYEIEKMIFENDISVYDLPEIWNEKYQKYLGITPNNYSDGILQDVHWSAGLFGYFPTYALGSVYASQFFYHMNKEFDVNKHIEEGNLRPILNYLTKNIHQFGSLIKANDLVFNICKEGINPNYYIEYLEQKFSKIYNL